MRKKIFTDLFGALPESTGHIGLLVLQQRTFSTIP
jgi:hypothetical protein